MPIRHRCVVAQAIKPTSSVDITGSTDRIDEAPELYDNDLPEGRFYCRTVAVEVKTPIE
ncbi:MAG: hypothetical protein RRA94_03905 [Bacteroidota bacterium]|nr:hypothetical protein [Bacteroidota bacterium]